MILAYLECKRGKWLLSKNYPYNEDSNRKFLDGKQVFKAYRKSILLNFALKILCKILENRNQNLRFSTQLQKFNQQTKTKFNGNNRDNRSIEWKKND